MYKKDRNHQIAFTDFNQPLGMQMNPNNRGGVRARTIPWDKIEDKYAGLFPSDMNVDRLTRLLIRWFISIFRGRLILVN